MNIFKFGGEVLSTGANVVTQTGKTINGTLNLVTGTLDNYNKGQAASKGSSLLLSVMDTFDDVNKDLLKRAKKTCKRHGLDEEALGKLTPSQIIEKSLEFTKEDMRLSKKISEQMDEILDSYFED